MFELRRFSDVFSYSLPEVLFLYSANAGFNRKSHKIFHACIKCLKQILHILKPSLAKNYKTLELVSPDCLGLSLRTQNCLESYHGFIMKNPTEYTVTSSFCYNCKYLILNFRRKFTCLDKSFIV